MPISIMGSILTSLRVDSPNLTEIYAARSHDEILKTRTTRQRREVC